MSVAAIVVRAGVSRRTFYEHFRNKEDAFLAAYDAVVHQLARCIRRAYLNETTVRERLRAGIRAYLQFLASLPCYFALRLVNCWFMLRAVLDEGRGRRLAVYEKGH